MLMSLLHSRRTSRRRLSHHRLSRRRVTTALAVTAMTCTALSGAISPSMASAAPPIDAPPADLSGFHQGSANTSTNSSGSSSSSSSASSGDAAWLRMWVRDIALRGEVGADDSRRASLCAGAAESELAVLGAPKCTGDPVKAWPNIIYAAVVGSVDAPARDAFLAGLSS